MNLSGRHILSKPLTTIIVQSSVYPFRSKILMKSSKHTSLPTFKREKSLVNFDEHKQCKFTIESLENIIGSELVQDIQRFYCALVDLSVFHVYTHIKCFKTYSQHFFTWCFLFLQAMSLSFPLLLVSLPLCEF